MGSLPTSDGKTITGAGCLLVLDNSDHAVETFSGGAIDGPWDMTSVSFGPLTELFVTNVLNGTVQTGRSVMDGGTVVRALLLATPSGPPRMLTSSSRGTWG